MSFIPSEIASYLESLIFKSNPNLRPAGSTISYTEEMINELVKCAEDPVYFITNYVKVVHPDRGLVLMELYDYQERMVTAYHENRYTIVRTARQQGKTTTAAAFFIWYILFNPDKSVAILANKQATADEILHRVRLAYENLPKWLQQGVKSFNRRSIELENGSRIFCAATSSSGIRGKTINCVDGDTIITIQTDDGNIENMKISDLYTKANSSIYKYENISTSGNDFHMEQTLDLAPIHIKESKYLKVYNNLINKAKERTFNTDTRYEIHHIIPRSLGGKDTADNLVKLTLREHFLAHKLLVKIKQGKEKSLMLQAIYMMSNTRGIKLSSRMYSEAKLNWINMSSNKIVTYETKQKISMTQIQLWNDQQYKNKMIKIFNSFEYFEKKSESIKNWIKNNEASHKQRMDKINKNPEKIKKTAEWHRGKKRPKETCDKISAKINERIELNGGALNKGMKVYYNPENMKSIQCFPKDAPIGWILGTGKKKPNRGKWYHNDQGEIRSFKINDDIPNGWKLGRK